MPRPINNIETSEIDFISTIAKLAEPANSSLMAGYPDYSNNREESPDTFVKILDKIGQDGCSFLYDKIANYIDDVSSIDTANLIALLSMVDTVGRPYKDKSYLDNLKRATTCSPLFQNLLWPLTVNIRNAKTLLGRLGLDKDIDFDTIKTVKDLYANQTFRSTLKTILKGIILRGYRVSTVTEENNGQSIPKMIDFPWVQGSIFYDFINKSNKENLVRAAIGPNGYYDFGKYNGTPVSFVCFKLAIKLYSEQKASENKGWLDDATTFKEQDAFIRQNFKYLFNSKLFDPIAAVIDIYNSKANIDDFDPAIQQTILDVKEVFETTGAPLLDWLDELELPITDRALNSKLNTLSYIREQQIVTLLSDIYKTLGVSLEDVINNGLDQDRLYNWLMATTSANNGKNSIFNRYNNVVSSGYADNSGGESVLKLFSYEFGADIEEFVEIAISRMFEVCDGIRTLREDLRTMQLRNSYKGTAAIIQFTALEYLNANLADIILGEVDPENKFDKFSSEEPAEGSTLKALKDLYDRASALTLTSNSDVKIDEYWDLTEYFNRSKDKDQLVADWHLPSIDGKTPLNYGDTHNKDILEFYETALGIPEEILNPEKRENLDWNIKFDNLVAFLKTVYDAGLFTSSKDGVASQYSGIDVIATVEEFYKNYKNKNFISKEMHPYIWNFTREVSTRLFSSQAITTTLNNIEYELINACIGQEGNIVDQFVLSSTADMSGYITRYELAGHSWSPKTKRGERLQNYEGLAFMPFVMDLFGGDPNAEPIVNDQLFQTWYTEQENALSEHEKEKETQLIEKNKIWLRQILQPSPPYAPVVGGKDYSIDSRGTSYTTCALTLSGSSGKSIWYKPFNYPFVRRLVDFDPVTGKETGLGMTFLDATGKRIEYIESFAPFFPYFTHPQTMPADMPAEALPTFIISQNGELIVIRTGPRKFSVFTPTTFINEFGDSELALKLVYKVLLPDNILDDQHDVLLRSNSSGEASNNIASNSIKTFNNTIHILLQQRYIRQPQWNGEYVYDSNEPWLHGQYLFELLTFTPTKPSLNIFSTSTNLVILPGEHPYPYSQNSRLVSGLTMDSEGNIAASIFYFHPTSDFNAGESNGYTIQGLDRHKDSDHPEDYLTTDIKENANPSGSISSHRLFRSSLQVLTLIPNDPTYTQSIGFKSQTEIDNEHGPGYYFKNIEDWSVPYQIAKSPLDIYQQKFLYLKDNTGNTGDIDLLNRNQIPFLRVYNLNSDPGFNPCYLKEAGKLILDKRPRQFELATKTGVGVHLLGPETGFDDILIDDLDDKAVSGENDIGCRIHEDSFRTLIESPEVLDVVGEGNRPYIYAIREIKFDTRGEDSSYIKSNTGAIGTTFNNFLSSSGVDYVHLAVFLKCGNKLYGLTPRNSTTEFKHKDGSPIQTLASAAPSGLILTFDNTQLISELKIKDGSSEIRAPQGGNATELLNSSILLIGVGTSSDVYTIDHRIPAALLNTHELAIRGIVSPFDAANNAPINRANFHIRVPFTDKTLDYQREANFTEQGIIESEPSLLDNGSAIYSILEKETQATNYIIPDMRGKVFKKTVLPELINEILYGWGNPNKDFTQYEIIDLNLNVTSPSGFWETNEFVQTMDNSYLIQPYSDSILVDPNSSSQKTGEYIFTFWRGREKLTSLYGSQEFLIENTIPSEEIKITSKNTGALGTDFDKVHHPVMSSLKTSIGELLQTTTFQPKLAFQWKCEPSSTEVLSDSPQGYISLKVSTLLTKDSMIVNPDSGLNYVPLSTRGTSAILNPGESAYIDIVLPDHIILGNTAFYNIPFMTVYVTNVSDNAPKFMLTIVNDQSVKSNKTGTQTSYALVFICNDNPEIVNGNVFTTTAYVAPLSSPDSVECPGVSDAIDLKEITMSIDVANIIPATDFSDNARKDLLDKIYLKDFKNSNGAQSNPNIARIIPPWNTTDALSDNDELDVGEVTAGDSSSKESYVLYAYGNPEYGMDTFSKIDLQFNLSKVAQYTLKNALITSHGKTIAVDKDGNEHIISKVFGIDVDRIGMKHVLSIEDSTATVSQRSGREPALLVNIPDNKDFSQR